jgi:hypothetical protein
MGFMILSMVFTLAFPTMAGAMTGYKGNVRAFVNATEENFVPFEQVTSRCSSYMKAGPAPERIMLRLTVDPQIVVAQSSRMLLFILTSFL